MVPGVLLKAGVVVAVGEPLVQILLVALTVEAQVEEALVLMVFPMVKRAAAVQSVLSGPEQLVNSHRQTQGICK